MNYNNRLQAEISRRNPQDDYDLLQRVGSGTYGDVFKVNMLTNHSQLTILRQLKKTVLSILNRQGILRQTIWRL